MTYQAPVRDYVFLLRDVLQLERYANLPAFADASMDTVEAILEDALPDHLTLFDIAVDPPALWEEQRLRVAHH